VPVDLISPLALAELGKQCSVRLIDVRTPEEYRQFHARGATNIPLDQLDPSKLLSGSDDAIYLICRAGSRGQQACEKLLAANPAARVINVEGGTLAWRAAKLPVDREREPWTPQKKVRTVSFALIALSILLAIFVHRGFLGISGLVGATLVFIGMTNMRGPGGVIGTQPSNQRKRDSNGKAESSAG
jgi:rhodanese-related sulfurtransferase